MESARRVVIAFLVGVIVGAGGFWAATRVSEVDLGQGSPLDKVSVVSNKLPVLADPAEAFARLDATTGAAWRMRFFHDHVEHYGGTPIAQAQQAIREVALLPDVRTAGVRGVYTNVLSPHSVAQNGALYMVWFDLPNKARDFLMSEPTVFVDPALEAERDSYWIGSFAVYYSPADAVKDQTEGLRAFLKLFVQCPMDHDPCQPAPDVANFDAWAPRAQ